MNRDTATTRTPPETGGVLFAGTGGVLLLLISPGKSGRIGWRGGIFIDTSKVLEYKCPCCGAGLVFGEDIQKMTCRSCGNTFDLADVRQYNDTMEEPDAETSPWDDRPGSSWSEEERASMLVYTCPSCAGELIADENTAATFCPFCGNPAILANRLSGGLRPDGVLPFRTSRADAKAAFLKLCKGKPLLPKFFTEQQRIEKITGIYVPYWLYDCDCSARGKYRATRVTHWSDSRYHYTKTDSFLLLRSGTAQFSGIPMDGSRKMDDTLMESLEPFDYSQIQEFHTGYLSGFLADKYDVDAQEGRQRIEQRVGTTMDDLLRESCLGFGALTPAFQDARIRGCKSRYVLLPVWMLYTQYRGKTYVFAMNGQTGKITGNLPVCPKRSWAWFGGVCAGVAALALLLQFLL